MNLPDAGDVPPLDEAAAAVDAYLRRAVPFGFSGSVLLATDGRVRLAAGYGWADRVAGRLNASTTVLSLGSITKPLTSTAVLRLVDGGALALHDRLGDRLPGVPQDKADITVEQLLSHSAGLIDATGDDFEPGARHDVLTAIMAAPLRFEPGTAYAYSNTGYSVLAAILEAVTGAPYESALAELVLNPAGMQRTGYRGPAWSRAELAHFYVGDADVGVHIDKNYPSWHVVGNGEMLSTVHDLYRLTRALDDGTLLRDATLSDAWTARHNDYGLGWSISDGPRGVVVEHDGASTNGVSARLRWYRDADTVLALLCNRDYSGGFLIHCVDGPIEALLGGDTVVIPPDVGARDPLAAERFAGTYLRDRETTARVTATDEGLRLTTTAQEVLDLLTGETSPPAPRAERNAASLLMVRSHLAGDDAALLAALGGDRERLERYRLFLADRLPGDPSAVRLDGSIPSDLSIGRVQAVQLSDPGGAAEHAVRLFWNGSTLVGLGYGMSPLLDLPLVRRDDGTFLVHHLALARTAEVAFAADPSGAVMTVSAGGRSIELRRADLPEAVAD